MRKFLLLLIIPGAILIVALAIFNSSPGKTTQPQNSASNRQTQPQSIETPKTYSESSRYLEFSQAVLENSSSTKRVLFFFANWCPTCKPADQNFKANLDKIPEDVTVIRVNYNDSETERAEKDLSKKYGVTYQHTFVQIDRDGNVVTIWNGGKIDELLKNLK